MNIIQEQLHNYTRKCFRYSLIDQYRTHGNTRNTTSRPNFNTNCELDDGAQGLKRAVCGSSCPVITSLYNFNKPIITTKLLNSINRHNVF